MIDSHRKPYEALPSAYRSIERARSPNTAPLKINSEIVGAVVSSIFQISIDQIFSPQRGKASVAFARQTAMYLTHITCGHSYTDIGCFFGRDRTTVSHACQLIEDKREDPDIDWSLDLMEYSILSLTKHFQAVNGKHHVRI